MATPLAAALAPFRGLPRLAMVPEKLLILGVGSVRVLADLIRGEGAAVFFADLVGDEGGVFGEEELEAIGKVALALQAASAVEKRLRGAESHLQDVVAVLKARRLQESSRASGPASSAPPPLPGLRAGPRRFRLLASTGAAGMAEEDKKDRDKWVGRFRLALLNVEAPVLEGLVGDELVQVAEMAVGRARPGTVRLRVRAWEAFSRWLTLNRGRVWPDGPRDLIDYIRAMVDVPAPATFPTTFGGAVRWFVGRTGFEGAEDLCEDGLFRRALQWAEAELADGAGQVRKAPRVPIILMLSWELLVVEAGAPLVHRVFAWARLIKVYGGLRWDDLQRLRPRDLELRSTGLVGRLTRTKTSGVGRRVRELPLFVPCEAYLATVDWISVGYHLWKELPPGDRDFFLPRPIANAEGFGTKVASAGDAAAMGTSLAAYMQIPRKVVEGQGVSYVTWELSPEALLPGALAGGWTNHSERATLPSALAAIGVGKDHRNLIGRWSPEGSDDYVRTYRAAVKELVVRFVSTVKSGKSYEAFDEEDAFAQVQARVVGQVGDEAAVEGAIATLRVLAEGVSRELAEFGGLVPTAVVSPLPVVEPPAPVDLDPFASKYLVVYTHNGKCARLHLSYGCWRARQMAFTSFEYLDVDPPPRDAYNAVCRGCWPGGAGVNLEVAEDDGGVGGSESSSGSSEGSG